MTNLQSFCWSRQREDYDSIVCPLSCHLLVPTHSHIILYHSLLRFFYHSFIFEAHVGLCPLLLTFSLIKFGSSPTLSLHHPLILSSFSHCTTLSLSCCPLTVPPSRCLIVPADCFVTSCCATILSSRCTALLSIRRPLTASPSHHLIAPAGCCVASRLAALSFSRRAALSSSRCTPAGCCVASIKRCHCHRTHPPLPPLPPITP